MLSIKRRLAQRNEKELLMQNFKLIAIGVAAILPSSALLAIDSESHYGDAEYGRGLAIRWCGPCHVVTADQERSMAGAPSFATIARSSNIDGDRLSRLLLAPHPKMERLELSRKAVDDIAAYIATLKK
jgi:mono/diheme cytochrome c family protein